MKSGFSLVELSIVLVILGLLTGGILSGQSLIRGAELRGVTSDYERHTAAVYAFRDKYMALPGDMKNATRFWQTATSCPGNSASPSTTTATCDGDGDGFIEYNTSMSNEIYRAWQHLANAGLVEGSYTGVSNSTSPGTTMALPGTNVPTGKMSNSGWNIIYRGSVLATSTQLIEGEYGNTLEFGMANPSVGSPSAPILTATEMWNLDTKLDDGRPGYGKVRSWEAQAGSCTNLASSTTGPLKDSEYLLTNSGVSCSMVVVSGI